MRWSLAQVAFAAASACLGCGSDASAPTEAPDSGSPDSPHTTATNISFCTDPAADSCDTNPTYMLNIRDSAEITVKVDPPGAHIVRFALLDASLDASLENDLVWTDDAGVASVTLTGPSASTLFNLRATADDGPWADAAVSVSDKGFGTLLVTPLYTGSRQIKTWTSTVWAGRTCASLPGIPPPDSSVLTEVPAGTSLRFDDLPVGPSIAVTVRSAHAVGGCLDVERVDPNQTRSVTVHSVDRPIDLGSTSLKFRLQIDPDGMVMQPMVGFGLTPPAQGSISMAESFVEALFAGGSKGGALLDAMQALAADPKQFELARAAGDWDTLAGDHMSSSVGTVGTIADRVLRSIMSWINAGTQALQAGSALSAQCQSSQGDGTRALLEPVTVAGIPAVDVGSPAENTSALAAEPGDVVHIAATVYLLPTRYVGASAQAGAISVEGHTPSDLLAALFACDTLAKKLHQAANPESAPCGSASCFESLCGDAVARMWQNACDASADGFDLASITFSVSAQAIVDGDAAIVSISGSWAGSALGRKRITPLSGTAWASKL